MDQRLISILRRLFSITIFFSCLFIGLLLSGCKTSTLDIVELRGKERSLRMIENELNDNLQASCHGMNSNDSEDVRNAFNNIVNVIIGAPSVEEMLFAENASLEDASYLMNETVEFLNMRDKLRKDISEMKADHDDNHDDWSWGWILGVIVSTVVGAFVAVKGLIAFGSPF